AAGPHTQQTPNLVAAYLTGCRFFELKTVQILDELDIEKPCIEATDEGYNTEWSTELTVPQAYEEYVKAWFLLPVLNKMFGLSQLDERAFIFNMSVGYDLAGIKQKKIDDFIENLKDASHHPVFLECKNVLKKAIAAGDIPGISAPDFVETISPKISHSITLSTMHGCPPEDQETICKYLMQEKKLHTFLKMNPTLLGFEYVKETFTELGYDHITLQEESFTHDMQWEPAVKMLNVLLPFAQKQGVEFGVKLSNTLAVVNDKGKLPTDEMYMSGRALFPLTINLAKKLSHRYQGKLPISYAGGANYFNVKELYKTGIRPITIATDILKPGGYTKFTQMATLLNADMMSPAPEKIDLSKLDILAQKALEGNRFRFDARNHESMKIGKKLEMLECFVAPCSEACPIHQDVPEYIRLIGEERYLEAFELILSKNPLPYITGYICDHKCMLKCVRNDYEEPVLIRELKRMAAEKGYQKYLETMKNQIPSNGIKVAVIGAGPAGLSSAYFLARAGFDVTVFDKTEKIGGTVMHTIPGFRLPQSAIQNDVELIKKMGVKFELNSDEKIDISKLKADGFKYINLAIGAWKSRSLSLEGNSSQICGAIKFLQEWKKNPQAIALGKNVAVIGGGNSAMDGARAARKTPGVENVYIIYRRTIREMPADREELDQAIKDGIIFHELLNPVAFQNGILKGQVMQLGEPDASGRKRPVPVKGKLIELKIDSVLSAIGEMVDYDILKANGIEVQENGKIALSEFWETNVENVFLSGDARRGPSTVVESIADGQKIAEGILLKEGFKSERVNASDYKFDHEARIKAIRAKKGVIKPTVETWKTDAEVTEETKRCLECNFICNKCVEVCPNRANVAIKVPGFQNENQILHLDGLCNECGNCQTFCPYDGAPYKDKFTLFWSEQDMKENPNNGFLLLSETEEVKFKLRLDDKIYYLNVDQKGNLKSLETDSQIKCGESLEAILEVIWTVYKNYGYLFV
ncbi:MAG TPA: putative selenate reductase subunit YgfK, partial [Candidatus Cloacimonadota bacterium]|nr:putative selenate reductase subunit YgfK [Candidatus Cloacimonadota bacterium]